MNHSTKRSFGHRLYNALGLAAAIMLLSACASTPQPPTTALLDAREAIANAEQAGARQYAAAELDEAQQKFILAERAVRNEEMIDAERYARESLVSAELASARTESARAMEINRQMGRSADALIEEMRRAGDQQ